MTVDYTLLRSVHRMLRQQTDLREQIERGPRKVKIAENNETQFRAELEQARESLTKARMQADNKQLQLSEREAKIEDLKNKRNACDSNKEFKLLTDQIAADEQANSVLADEILELLERIDQLEESLKTAQSNLGKAEQETKSVAAKVDEELARLNSELERVTGELTEAEKRIPGEVAVEYKRMVAKLGESALAESDLSTCGNCYTTLTPQTINELNLKRAVFCQGCGSLMYVVENTTANS